MIILDTNVISELFQLRPNPDVLNWLMAQPQDRVYLTTINAAELLSGIEMMPHGRRRRERAEQIRIVIEEEFQGRILPFCLKSAAAYARIRASARKIGVVIPPMDLQVAAIASANGFSVATRDLKHFGKSTVPIIDPWTLPDDAS